jgi:hypothetical protein
MLLSVMILCAVGAILLFALDALAELRDIWKHPDHRPSEDDHTFPRPKSK